VTSQVFNDDTAQVFNVSIRVINFINFLETRQQLVILVLLCKGVVLVEGPIRPQVLILILFHLLHLVLKHIPTDLRTLEL
jgi:hypothetical protein